MKTKNIDLKANDQVKVIGESYWFGQIGTIQRQYPTKNDAEKCFEVKLGVGKLVLFWDDELELIK